MILKFNNEEVKIDNDKVITIYTDPSVTLQKMDQEDYRREALVLSIKNKNFGINYLKELWNKYFKNYDFKNQDVEIFFLDEDQTSSILLESVSHVDYQIEIVKNQVEELIKFYK